MDNPTCRKCLLEDHILGVTIGDDGICNHCKMTKDPTDIEKARKKNRQKFETLIERYRNKSSHDCIVAYSGGKDSTYTLYLLKEKYDLNIQALTFDNWFQSEKAHENVKRVISAMDLDHVTIRPAFGTFKKIIKRSIEKGFYPGKTMQRASAICTSCLSMIRFSALRSAIEQRIPFVVLGLSPGQAPVVTSIFRTTPEMLKSMQDFMATSFKKSIGDSCMGYFLEKRHFDQTEAFPYTVNPLAFSDYDESTIYQSIRQFGWEKPSDTDANSTNCLLNSLANQIHEKHYGFNPYMFELSQLVRENSITRKDALKRLKQAPDPEMVARVCAMLDLDISDI